MSKEFEIIITDTSCLILLDKIDMLNILSKLSINIYISPEIKSEFGDGLPSWIKIKEVKDNIAYIKLLEDLDSGEASAICLYNESHQDTLLIIDDLKARKYAKYNNLYFTGTFGLLIKAKQMGLIKDIEELIKKLNTTNFRIDEKLINLLRN